MRRLRTKSSVRQVPISLIQRVVFAVTLLLVAALLWFGAQKYPVLQVVNISCQTTQNHECPETMQADLQAVLRTPLFFIDHVSAAQTALASHPVAVQSVDKTLGGDVRVIIAIETPIYSVQPDMGETYWMSRSGIISNQIDDSSVELPILYVIETTVAEVQENHSSITQLLHYADQLGLPIEALVWHAHFQVEVRFRDKPVPVLIDISDWQTHLSRAQAVYAIDSLETAKTTQYLDARFELPVLREQLEQERVSQ